MASVSVPAPLTLAQSKLFGKQLSCLELTNVMDRCFTPLYILLFLEEVRMSAIIVEHGLQADKNIIQGLHITTLTINNFDR